MRTGELRPWVIRQRKELHAATLRRQQMAPERTLSERGLVQLTLYDIFHSLMTALSLLNVQLNIIDITHKASKYSSVDQLMAEIELQKKLEIKPRFIIKAVLSFLIEGEQDLSISPVKDTLMQYEVILKFYIQSKGVSFSIECYGIDELSDYLNMPPRDFHAVLTDLFMAPVTTCQGKRGRSIKVDASKIIRDGKTYIRISEEDNGGTREYPLLPQTNDLIRKYGGFSETEMLADGVSRVSVFFPRA